MKEADWLEIAKSYVQTCRERVIVRDSDGNCCRVDYREGVEEAMAKAASQQISRHAATHMIQEVMEAYQFPVLEENRELRTS